MMDGLRTGKEEDYEAWKKARDRHALKGVNKHFHLNAAVSKWPTPIAGDSVAARNNTANRGPTAKKAHSGNTLTDMIWKREGEWPTPSAQGSAGETSPDLVRKGAKLVNTKTGRVLQTNLATEAKIWPTPNSNLLNDAETPESFLKRQAKWSHKYHNSMPLGVKVKTWPTPGAADGEKMPLQHKGGNPTLEGAARASSTSPPAPKETGQESPKNSGLRLNPLFVEWLMGFPSGWISFEPSAMPLSPSKQPSPSENSGGDCPTTTL
tara:strand:- start:106 stop:900 length:795 start_codon:yes stop_codon:yes gene_type:complete